MKLINLLIALVIVAVLTITAWKVWFPGDDEGGGGLDTSPPSRRFMRTCQETSANIKRPETYCRCLWAHGVKNPKTLFTSAKNREKAAACQVEAER